MREAMTRGWQRHMVWPVPSQMPLRLSTQAAGPLHSDREGAREGWGDMLAMNGCDGVAGVLHQQQRTRRERPGN